MREPAFWWRSGSLAGALLAPFAAVYGAVAANRMARPGRRAAVPVICVGNFTHGGSGKTPTAIALAQLLAAAGKNPVLLTRGYGGNEAGPVAVDPQRHHAGEVGDEALLLAEIAPTIVARDRFAGAQAATGAGVIVMDDGLQNPALKKDLTIAVVDGRRGIGNGKVFPAGPLRAPLAAQFAQTNAVLVIGGDAGAAGLDSHVRKRRLPVFHGELAPDRAAIDAVAHHKFLAFAGIGDPSKFFATATAAGLDVRRQMSFPDHHRYTAAEAADLIRQAEHDGLQLITTAKDHARMSGDPALAALTARAHVLPVRLNVREEAAWRDFVLSACAARA